MVRILLFSLGIFGLAVIAPHGLNGELKSVATIESPAHFQTKPKKSNKVDDKFKEVVEPLVEFKNALEPHLPQKELNTVKRVAFQVFLIARRYL